MDSPDSGRPTASTPAVSGRHARSRRGLIGAALAACLLALFALAPACLAAPAQLASTSTARALPAIVFAQGHGLQLAGRPGALRGTSVPELSSMTEAQVDALGSLPERNVFFRGADCEWRGRTSRFASPLTLTFTLPKALFRETPLPLCRYEGKSWRRMSGRAVVGEVNTTASATITRPGRYALLLTGDWKTVTEDGDVLVEYTETTSPTVLLDPQVKASGSTSDPAVIAATMDVTGSTEEKAVSTLRSFDSTSTPVQVVTLRLPSAMERYWSGTSSVGRWFSPSGQTLLSPAEARRVYALPADNTAENVTLSLVKRGAALICGACSDMTDVSGYGPWATGGGPQYFGPKVSTYPPPLYDPAVIVTLADLRWEKDAVDAIQW
jgi:hypothetical protein